MPSSSSIGKRENPVRLTAFSNSTGVVAALSITSFSSGTITSGRRVFRELQRTGDQPGVVVHQPVAGGLLHDRLDFLQREGGV